MEPLQELCGSDAVMMSVVHSIWMAVLQDSDILFHGLC